MNPGIDGLWTVHYQGVNGREAGGVATFIDGSMFGGDSGHVFKGSVDLQERSVGAYFMVRNVVPNIPNALSGRKFIEFHLKGELQDRGDRICAKIESSLVPAMVVAPIEFRKKVDFVNGQTLLTPRESSIQVMHTGGGRRGEQGKFGGFWTIEIETEQGIGTGVLLLAQGSAVGGNSNYTLIGTTQTEENKIKTRLLMANFMTGGPNLFGYFGNCEMDITGSLQQESLSVRRAVTGDVQEHSQIQGTAVVVHLPHLKGHCRLKKKDPLPHHSNDKSFTGF